jgi:hypothetical protein
MIAKCNVCGGELASLRPIKIWHGLDGSHSVEYLDEWQHGVCRRTTPARTVHTDGSAT